MFKVLIVGLGEVGRPLFEIVKGVYETRGWDWEGKGTEKTLPFEFAPVSVLHICYPYSDSEFVPETISYIKTFNPELTIIESTVYPGTTRRIWDEFKSKLIVHSPYRGNKKDGFKWGFFTYTKFIGPMTDKAGLMAEHYYQSLGFKTQVCNKPEETEFMKLIETTYYGLCISWFQEIERICKNHDLDFFNVNLFLKTVETESGGKVPRPTYFPGIIGGHCVIPNAHLLHRAFNSKFIEALLDSNAKKMREE